MLRADRVIPLAAFVLPLANPGLADGQGLGQGQTHQEQMAGRENARSTAQPERAFVSVWDSNPRTPCGIAPF